jgi:hypothetical protein
MEFGGKVHGWELTCVLQDRSGGNYIICRTLNIKISFDMLENHNVAEIFIKLESHSGDSRLCKAKHDQITETKATDCLVYRDKRASNYSTVGGLEYIANSHDWISRRLALASTMITLVIAAYMASRLDRLQVLYNCVAA